jgi:hypothetical protein
LDFHNRTPEHSPDIETTYFYSGKGWSFRQDNQECAQTSSDIPGFKTRHLIRPPVRRLTKGAWAQIKLVGEKVMGYSWEGTELKDSYRLTGTTVVRVIAARGTYDSPINLDVEASEFPF